MCPAFGWEMAPASDKQKETLEKLGILPDEIDNAGKAAPAAGQAGGSPERGAYDPETDPFP